MTGTLSEDTMGRHEAADSLQQIIGRANELHTMLSAELEKTGFPELRGSYFMYAAFQTVSSLTTQLSSISRNRAQVYGE